MRAFLSCSFSLSILALSRPSRGHSWALLLSVGIIGVWSLSLWSLSSCSSRVPINSHSLSLSLSLSLFLIYTAFNPLVASRAKYTGRRKEASRSGESARECRKKRAFLSYRRVFKRVFRISGDQWLAIGRSRAVRDRGCSRDRVRVDWLAQRSLVARTSERNWTELTVRATRLAALRGPGETPCHLSSYPRPALSTPHAAMCETRVIFLAQACIPLRFIVPRSLSHHLSPSLGVLLAHLQSSLAVSFPSYATSPSRESGNRISPRDTTAPIKLASRSHSSLLLSLLRARSCRSTLSSFERRSSWDRHHLEFSQRAGRIRVPCLPSESRLALPNNRGARLSADLNNSNKESRLNFFCACALFSFSREIWCPPAYLPTKANSRNFFIETPCIPIALASSPPPRSLCFL